MLAAPSVEEGRNDQRRCWLRRLGALGAGLVLVVAGIGTWGHVVEPNLIDVERYTVRVPGLPEQWRGETVAVVADLQFGMWWGNERTSHAVIDRIVAQPPAAVLIAGDLVYGRDRVTAEVQQVVDLLAVLPWSGIPTVVVLGNHDYESGVAEVLGDRLAAKGVTVLRNSSVALPPPSAPDRLDAILHVVGIGPHLPGRDRPAAAVATVPDGAPRLVLMHNPVSFAALPPGLAPVAVAGHTHGGQIRLPFVSWPSADVTSGADLDRAQGWIDGYGAAGNRLYVNRGIGMSVVPLRVNCPPEVTMLTLEA